ncbi:replication protein A 70 kDa DNA-binding subunit [Striga asiatica]|uniref:Replication protein A 70 kDa DNA-binding subunit n=1 Tax=Striga asiatica TaxID=4170 RepID=A0A5A7QTC9_STRAF|nr:replication protein A 70 kDa DNA-binding subunit [Striga asiatica]
MVDFWKAKKDEPVVIILQYAMVKRWGAHVNLQNSLFTSKLIINEDMDAIVEFMNNMDEIVEFMKSLKEMSKPNSVSYSSRDYCINGSASVNEDFPTNLEFKTISDLQAINEECSCVVYCNICNIQTSQNWYYMACNKCYHKVTEQGGKCWCNHCDCRPNAVLTRFKVHVRVEDKTCSTSFVLFDPQVSPILGKSSADLKNALEAIGDGDSFPNELEILTMKSYLFKIDIKRYNLNQSKRVYTVARLTANVTIISKWCDLICEEANINTAKTPMDVFENQENVIDLELSTVSSVADNAKIGEATPSSKKCLSGDINHEDGGDGVPHSQGSCNGKNVKVKIEKMHD